MNKILEVIKTPQESVNDDSVVIVKIHVKNGDKVKKDHFPWFIAFLESKNTIFLAYNV